MQSRRLRLLAFFLPVVGAILIMPPLVFVFEGADSFGGVPGIIAYLFAVWLALICVAFVLQRQMRKTGDVDSSGRPE